MARGIIIVLFLFVLLAYSPAYAGPVVVAVAGAALSSISITAAGALAFSWASFGLSLALSVVSTAFTPKQKKSGSYNELKSSGSTQQFRQAVTPREIVYGEVRKSGPITYVGVTNNNRYLHMMIALASHEVQEIGEVFIDDYSITPDMLDANGYVTSGRYATYVRIRKVLGSDTQGADSFAVSEIPGWTTDHKLQGIAYIYVRLNWIKDVFPNGTPNFSVYMKGKKLFDPRDGVTRFSPNIPLMIRDYWTNESLGMKINQDYIDDDTTETAANIADEFVTVTDINLNVLSVDTTYDLLRMNCQILPFVLGDKVNLTSGTIGGLSSATDYYVIPYARTNSGSGRPAIRLATSYANAIDGVYINITSGTTGTITKIAEPRYHGGGILKLDQDHAQNLSELFPCMAGTITNSGGKWRMYAGAYRTPTVSLSENDLAGAIQVVTKISKQDRFNRIQGAYTAALNNGNPSDYPIIKNSTYADQDGGIILKTRDLAFTQRPHTAQRIAKSELERSRQEITFTADFKLTAFKILIGDNFYFTFDRYGWSNKVFECVNWNLTVKGTAPVIQMTCREMASTVYDWNSGEETAIDPAPDSNLPSIFDIDAPTGLRFDSSPVETLAGDTLFLIRISWDAHPDDFVLSGGNFEVQYKLSSDAEYKPSWFVTGEQTSTDVVQGSPNTSYDIRIRAINSYGVRSAWQSLSGVISGSSGGVTSSENWGAFVGDPPISGTDQNWGAFVSDPPISGTDEDWGGFI